MRSLKDQISQVVQSGFLVEDLDPTAVLVTGGSGSGKDLGARALHYNGPRKEEPCLEINCAATSSNLWKRNFSVTTAVPLQMPKKNGLFEAVNKGTRFLDEIGDMKSFESTFF